MEKQKRTIDGLGLRKIRIHRSYGFGLYKKQSFWQRIRLYKTPSVVFLAVLLITGVVLRAVKIRAEIAYYYPDNCLGNWVNPQNVEAKPELDNNADPTKFNHSNSAVYAGGEKQLFCGKFQGKIPDSAELQGVKLKLSWTKELAAVNDQVPQGVATPSALPAVAEPEQPDAAEPAIENPSAEQPTSFLNNFIKVAKAEDVLPDAVAPDAASNSDVQPVETVASDPDPEPETVAEPSQSEQTQAVEPAKSTDDTPAIPVDSITTVEEPVAEPTFTESPKADVPEFNIRYSLDGSNWQTVAEIPFDDLNAEIDLPTQSVDDLNAVQISVESYYPKDLDFAVLLESMVLEAQYKQGQESVTFGPDLSQEIVLDMKSSDALAVVETANSQTNQSSIWMYENYGEKQWQLIAASGTVASGSPIALKDGYAFWLSADQLAIVGYDSFSKNYFGQTIDGSSTQVYFGDNTVAVRFYNGNFEFSEPEAGRLVQPDDNSEKSEYYKQEVLGIGAVKDIQKVDTAENIQPESGIQAEVQNDAANQ